MLKDPAKKNKTSVPQSFWDKLKSIFLKEKGEGFGQGAFIFGLFSLAFLLPGSPGLILPFIQAILTGLGINIAGEFFKQGSVDYEKIEESVINAFRKLKESEGTLSSSGLSKDEVEDIINVIKECAGKSSGEHETMVAVLKKEIGNEFNCFRELLPTESQKQEFDVINGKLDILIKGQTEIKTELAEIKTDVKSLMKIFSEERLRVDDRILSVGYRPPTIDIYGRDEIVKEYINILMGGKKSILWLHGMGGIGKSTIASMIFEILSNKDSKQKKFDRFVWYGLSDKTEFETALYEILCLISGRKIETIQSNKPPFEQHLDLLGTHLTQQKVLLVLDNIDSAMKTVDEAGQFVDERWCDFLKKFSGKSSALIVTSRPTPKIILSCLEFLKVKGIGQKEALGLMKERGLKDNDNVLIEAYNLLGGHPMALNTLAITVVQFMPDYGGYLSKAGDIMRVLRDSPDPSQNPILLFEEIIKRLPKHLFDILTAMPILFRPEISKAIEALCRELDRNGYKTP